MSQDENKMDPRNCEDSNARDMGKKGSWLSAIKRVFLPHSKDKPPAEPEKRSTKEKKKNRLPKLKHGESNSFLPMFREPSSIEKILDEAEREHNLIFRPPTPTEQPRTPSFVPQRVASPPRIPSQRLTSPKVESPRAASPRAASPIVASPRAVSPRGASPRAASPRGASPRAVSTSFTPPKVASPRSTPRHKERYYRPEPTPESRRTSAIKIQAAYRGYMARRSFRALKGLVRLQGVMRGQNVKRQVTTALKYMQLFVRVQNQVQSRRIEMLEKEAQRHTQFRNDKDVESTLGKWSLMSEAGNQEDWDESKLTKEEVEARLQKKVEAVVKRERAKAYANSHQRPPKLRSTGFPWWCNWLERQLPLVNPSESEAAKNAQLTPATPRSDLKPSPRPSLGKQIMSFDNIDTPTPRSTKSTAFISTRPARTPVYRNTPGSNSRYSRTRASGADSPFAKDDDSLVSCPPFSVPRYMAPTVSAQAKLRASSNPRERFPGTPGSEKRRMSFPVTPGTSPFKWNKDSASQLDKQSVGNMSVDSTVSMPALAGRKPFNRFV